MKRDGGYWCKRRLAEKRGKQRVDRVRRKRSLLPREWCLQKGPGAYPAHQGVLHSARGSAGRGNRRGLCGEVEQEPLKYKRLEIPTVPEEQERGSFFESWLKM